MLGKYCRVSAGTSYLEGNSATAGILRQLMAHVPSTAENRKQPLAVEAYVQLLRLQVPLAIVLNMIPSDSPEKPWMKTYLQGMDNMYRMKYQGKATMRDVHFRRTS